MPHRSSLYGHSPPTSSDGRRFVSIDIEPPQDNNMLLISYNSPNVVRSQINAWTNVVSRTAIVTAFFAINASIVLGIVRSDDALKGRDGKAVTLLTIASYGAILFNSITTLASLVLMDCLGDIEFNEARNPQRRATEGRVARTSGVLQLLTTYGARKHFIWIFCQWVAYFVIGLFFMLSQIVVYMWLREGIVLSISLTAMAGATIIVLFLTRLYDNE
ncbi:hypothetical protein B0H16DRAFT_1688901 [Mycena metata]|uniref:Uncharacterized protein n=1 Tax=Mycena metata TaxID=1033252 RepID=A0AAD7JD86_9AGAR|nr:hypothetical protein B0H16DRAFT_1688901 [Mycena metata]